MQFSAEAYVEAVLSGETVACRWVKLACERYRRDRDTGEARGLRFDEGAAKVAIAFFGLLRHWKGEWAGEPIGLEPWQQFIIWNLFGWKREDGARRFRTGYIEVARKNGKTTMASGAGLYLMVADGEPGAEVYSAATKKDQAKISHADATKFVENSPQLRRLISVVRDNLSSTANNSKFEPLGRDSDSLDGLNIHGAIADELHAWKDAHMWDVLETGMGSRRQPLMLAITTAGFDRNSLCYQHHTYVEQVLSGVIEDDSYFGIIYTLDEGDDWQEEANWVKANPNLDISKKRDDMRRLAARAQEMPARLNAFLRLHLNIWTQSETRWINRAAWDAGDKGPIDEGALAGRRCYAGLDLSSNTDVTALALVFPPDEEDGAYEALLRFWIPEENMWERVRRDRVPYDAWVRQGYIEATPGNVVDYEFILAQLRADAQAFDLRELAFDRWGSQKIITDLQEVGFTVEEKTHKQSGLPLLVQFGQGFASMSGPMKELEKLILSQRLAHGNNPVLTWMADNLVVREDPAGNVKPDKEKSIEKIDGMVALVMALDRAVRHGVVVSVYEARGVRVL